MKNAVILVIAGHNHALIRQICTHALWMENGRMKGFGEVAPVLPTYDLPPQKVAS